MSVAKNNNNDNQSLLSMAIRNWELDIVEVLAKSGVDMGAVDEHGQTPLSLAASGGNLEIVKFLVGTACVEVEPKDDNGRTPISNAARNGRLEVVKFLYLQGANVNTRDNEGETPLSLAANWGRLEVVKFLVGLGVDTETKNRYGRTPLFLAADYGRLGVVEFLKEVITRRKWEQLVSANVGNLTKSAARR